MLVLLAQQAAGALRPACPTAAGQLEGDQSLDKASNNASNANYGAGGAPLGAGRAAGAGDGDPQQRERLVTVEGPRTGVSAEMQIFSVRLPCLLSQKVPVAPASCRHGAGRFCVFASKECAPRPSGFATVAASDGIA